MPCRAQNGRTRRSIPRSLEIVQDLIAGDPIAARVTLRFLEVVDVEVADAERADLAVVDEPLERRERLVERVRAAPVQQVAVEVVGAQPAQRAFAGADDAGERRVRR